MVVEDLLSTLPPPIGTPGINTGLVVARRSDARAGDDALTGDTVNTAARLRGLARPVRWSSARAPGCRCRTSPVPTQAPVEVKGKEHPLVAYRVLGGRVACRRRRAGEPARLDPGALHTRIDRLPTVVKLSLQAAAVLR
jgi:hypothetical protein